MFLSVAMTVLVLNVHHKGGQERRAPSWVRKVILEWGGRLVFVKKACKENRVYPNHPQIAVIATNGQYSHQKMGAQDKGEKTVQSVTEDETQNCSKDFEAQRQLSVHAPPYNQHSFDVQQEWKLIAFVIDRICLAVFLILAIMMTLIIFSSHKKTLPVTQSTDSP